jgi:glycosyltransferase involved in cell wall biosynthesis
MAGPAIRSWELTRALSVEHEVQLATPAPLPPQGPAGAHLLEATRGSVMRVLAEVDVVVVRPSDLQHFPFLLESRTPRVVDLYDPAVVEDLEIHRGLRVDEQRQVQARDLDLLRRAASWGDFFLCASERQRHFWLGVLATLGRVNPLTYERDPTLRSLVAVVPFGLPDTPPDAAPGTLRSRFPAIQEGDPVGIWAGGIWNWFDPLTLIRATAQAVEHVPNLRIVFLGAGHPSPSVPAMEMASRAQTLARELGLEGQHVLFNREWVPYEQRAAFLLDADFAVALHFDTVETTFAFRTRMLDHLWAGLPSLVTGGDALSELVTNEGLGQVVDPEDVDGVAAALRRFATDDELRQACRSATQRAAPRLRWSRVAAPLLAYCAAPLPAADRGVRDPAPRRASASAQRLRRALRSLRTDGLRGFTARTYRYARRRFG